MTTPDRKLVCRACGQAHRVPALRPGDTAACVRCGTTLRRRSWFGNPGRWAMLLAALMFALTAGFTPLVTLGKFGRERASSVFDVAGGLWAFDRPAVAASTWWCGVAAPVGLLLLLLSLQIPGRSCGARAGAGPWHQAAHRLAFWSMPEVQVLGVLVAFFKLGDVVDVDIGAGLPCYAAAAFCLLAAWRSFEGSAGPRRT